MSCTPSLTLLSPSPPPHAEPLPLADRIDNPPLPLTLEECIDDPGLETELLPTSPLPIKISWPSTPEGYVHFDPANPNHAKYARKIHLYRDPNNTPQFPHFIHFVHNLGLNQHYMLTLHDNAVPPTAPYGWTLEAAPFMGPFPFPVYKNNEVLGIFDARYNKSRQVDVALYAICDYGLLAEVDKYRSQMLDYEDIVTCHNKVNKDLQDWHARITPTHQCLVTSQARSHVHPYLNKSLPIPAPPSIPHVGDEIMESHFLTMKEALLHDDQAGAIEDDRPWYHNSFGHSFVFTDHPDPFCPYCKNTGHSYWHCPCPHTRCHLTIGCIIPTNHHAYGNNCPYANMHITDNNNKERYVGHVDEDQSGDSWLLSVGTPELVRGWCYDHGNWVMDTNFFSALFFFHYHLMASRPLRLYRLRPWWPLRLLLAMAMYIYSVYLSSYTIGCGSSTISIW